MLAPSIAGAQGLALATTQLPNIHGLALDNDETVYVTSDTDFGDTPGLHRFGSRVYQITPERMAMLVAGANERSSRADRASWRDGRPALEARFSKVIAMAFDGAGNLFLLDADNQVIRRIKRRLDGNFGEVETYAGIGVRTPGGSTFAPGTEVNALETTFGFTDAGGTYAGSQIRFGGMAFDRTRNRLWVADTYSGVVRGILLTESPLARTVLSIGKVPSGSTSLPTYVALGRDPVTDRDRWLYVSKDDCTIWRVDLDDGVANKIAGTVCSSGAWNPETFDGRQANTVVLLGTAGLATHRNVLYSGQGWAVARINTIDGSIDRIVGLPTFSTMNIDYARPALEASGDLGNYLNMVANARGDLYVSLFTEADPARLLVRNNGSTTQVTVSPTNSVPGDSVTLTARINGDEPTGTVSFRSQTGTSTFSNLCLNVPLTRVPASDDGTATCNTTMLPAGSGNIVADYAGDLNNLGSNAVAPFARSSAAATLTLASVSPGTVAPGVNVTATVSIALRGNPISPEGVVTVEYLDRNNVVPLCSFNYPAANGTASASGSCSGSFPTPGPRQVRARWQSLTGIDPAESNQLAVSVTGFPSTTTTLSTTNPAVFGQALGLTATIEETSSFTPTGSVDFVDVRPSGDVVLCAAVALASTVATCNVAAGTLPAGERNLQARYGGDVRFEPSTGSLTQTVRKAGTTLSVIGTVPSAAFGGTPIPVVVGLVVNAPGAGQPSGRVIVAATGTTPGATAFLSCEIDLPSTPQALSCPLPFSATGRYRVGASYAGDTNFDGSSASATVEHVVEPLFRDEFE
jgi:hypothetical protein